MPLRCSPVRSPAFLSANRINARKSTGPRTAAGKARSCPNALKHGRRASGLGRKLLAAGDYIGASLHERTRWELLQIFGRVHGHPAHAHGQDARATWYAEYFANQVYALARQAERLRGSAGLLRCLESDGLHRSPEIGQPGTSHLRTKPECASFFGASQSWLPALFPIRITDPARRLAVSYWVQHNCYWRWEPMINVTRSSESSPGKGLERKLRRRAFLMRRPRLWERIACQVAGVGPGTPAGPPRGTGTPACAPEPQEMTQQPPGEVSSRAAEDRAQPSRGLPALPPAQGSSGTERKGECAEDHARKMRRAQRAARKLLGHFDANGGRWWRYGRDADHLDRAEM